MRRYSPPYYSPPRRGYGGRGRSPPRRGYSGYGGRKEPNNGSLLVRNIPLNCRQPRGFAFVQFVDPYDASDAQYHMNGQVFGGREITVVLAAETRKRPEEMRHRARVRTLTITLTFPFTLSSVWVSFKGPTSVKVLSYSPAPRRRADYSPSPRRRDSGSPRSPRDHRKRQSEEDPRRSNSPDHGDANRKAGNGYAEKATYDVEETHERWRSPGRASRSPSGSRSRSADISPRRSR
ncbi:Serine/arginine-rich splicing factor 33 [Acorus calamus]|uniref:Serine/arginine-rich splicing factor 33 n=1 Tax=Acorus calamus TaxID=4465 RepID=A0AAV9EIX1_ACOCL|nr:Serine/arginine-rich splicing factor 33 [Acorus calamus]